MTQKEFADRIITMQDTLCRISATILPQRCDREDTVQGAMEKAWPNRAAYGTSMPHAHG